MTIGILSSSGRSQRPFTMVGFTTRVSVDGAKRMMLPFSVSSAHSCKAETFSVGDAGNGEQRFSYLFDAVGARELNSNVILMDGHCQ